jgi:hypothetical protein
LAAAGGRADSGVQEPARRVGGIQRSSSDISWRLLYLINLRGTALIDNGAETSPASFRSNDSRRELGPKTLTMLNFPMTILQLVNVVT